MPITNLVAVTGTATLVPASGTLATSLFRTSLSISVAGSVTFMDGTATAFGPIILATGTPYVLPYEGVPWFTGGTGNPLTLVVSGVASVNGNIVYSQG